MVLGEAHLRRLLTTHADYNELKTHRSLTKKLRSIASLSVLAPSHHARSWAAFTINIAESNIRHTQPSQSTRPERGWSRSGPTSGDCRGMLRPWRHADHQPDPRRSLAPHHRRAHHRLPSSAASFTTPNASSSRATPCARRSLPSPPLDRTTTRMANDIRPAGVRHPGRLEQVADINRNARPTSSESAARMKYV